MVAFSLQNPYCWSAWHYCERRVERPNSVDELQKMFTLQNDLVILVNMSASSVRKQIPSSAKPFFQEYNADLLDVDAHAPLIMERILAYGNREEVRWLINTYGRDQVRGWVLQTGASRLSRRRYHLWCFVFEIPQYAPPARIWPH